MTSLECNYCFENVDIDIVEKLDIYIVNINVFKTINPFLFNFTICIHSGNFIFQ